MFDTSKHVYRILKGSTIKASLLVAIRSEKSKCFLYFNWNLYFFSFGVATEQPKKKPDPATNASAFDVSEQINGAPYLAEAGSSRGFAHSLQYDGFQESFERLWEQ